MACLIAFGCMCTTPHAAYGMGNTVQKKATEMGTTLAHISNVVGVYGTQLITHAKKHIDQFAQNNPAAFFGGLALASIGGYIALRGITSKIKQITVGFACMGLGLYVAIKAMETGGDTNTSTQSP